MRIVARAAEDLSDVRSLTDAWKRLWAALLLPGKLHFLAGDELNQYGCAGGGSRAVQPHGSVYFADEQLAGRGRGDHKWHSAAGAGLYVSVLLRPAVPAARLPLLPLAAGLAAAGAIREVAGSDQSICAGRTTCLLVRARRAASWWRRRLREPALASRWWGSGSMCISGSLTRGLATAATSLDLEAGRTFLVSALLLALLKCWSGRPLALADAGGRRDDSAAGRDGFDVDARAERSGAWAAGLRGRDRGSGWEWVSAGVDGDRTGDGTDRRVARSLNCRINPQKGAYSWTARNDPCPIPSQFHREWRGNLDSPPAVFMKGETFFLTFAVY